MKITKDVLKFSELFTNSRGSRKLALVLTVEATHNKVKGLGEAGPYARCEETLTYVIAKIETHSEIFLRDSNYATCYQPDRRAMSLIVRFGMLRQRRPVKGFRN